MTPVGCGYQYWIFWGAAYAVGEGYWWGQVRFFVLVPIIFVFVHSVGIVAYAQLVLLV